MESQILTKEQKLRPRFRAFEKFGQSKLRKGDVGLHLLASVEVFNSKHVYLIRRKIVGMKYKKNGLSVQIGTAQIK